MCLPDDADAYNVSPLIIPRERHRPAPKHADQTNRHERWSNPFNRSFTRKTLALV
jgi:hypothetical protein